MPGDYGEFIVNIGLGINFLAFGTLFVTLGNTSSYENYFIPAAKIVQKFNP